MLSSRESDDLLLLHALIAPRSSETGCMCVLVMSTLGILRCEIPILSGCDSGWKKRRKNRMTSAGARRERMESRRAGFLRIAQLWGALAFPRRVDHAQRGRASTAAAAGGSTPAEGRSASAQPNEVTGYHVQAADASIGQVDGSLFDDRNWSLRYLIIDTRNWMPWRHVLVATDWVQRVSWEDHKAHAELTRDEVRDSPEYDQRSFTGADEQALYRHYNRLPPITGSTIPLVSIVRRRQEEVFMKALVILMLLAAFLATAATAAERPAGSGDKSTKSAEIRFESLDRDRDRALDKREAKADASVAAQFDSFDINLDGYISRAEYLAYLQLRRAPTLAAAVRLRECRHCARWPDSRCSATGSVALDVCLALVATWCLPVGWPFAPDGAGCPKRSTGSWLGDSVTDMCAVDPE
jgi:hypothetical protein